MIQNIFGVYQIIRKPHIILIIEQISKLRKSRVTHIFFINNSDSLQQQVWLVPQQRMRSVFYLGKRLFCDLNLKNRQFLKKVRKYEQDVFIHQKAGKVDDKKMADFVVNNAPQKIAYEMAQRSDYDKELRDFISKFNTKHKNKISLLDFSSYITELGDLKDKPLKKEDIELIKQFQKRKIDQRVSQISSEVRKNNENSPSFKFMNVVERQRLGLNGGSNKAQIKSEQKHEKELDKRPFTDETQQYSKQQYRQGPFVINDDFVIILLNVKSNTKVTTLNRINSYKTLLFMGNGNGIISYAKGKGKNTAQSLQKAFTILSKNLIAIPRDSKCTLPLHITKRFQDYTLYLRPNPGFNAHGHPIIAFMLTLAGIDHCGFKVSHTEKNVYNVLKVFYKSIVTNTTPQELAERQGFKVYRHQFIRPLTYVRTHGAVAEQAKVRRFWRHKVAMTKNPFE